MLAASAALALAPWPCAVYAPRWILGHTLEENVDQALPLAVLLVVAATFLLNPLLVTREHQASLQHWIASFARGIGGLVVGTALFHLVIILFGAPIEVLVQRTAWLALLLASMTTAPLSMHVGFQWHDWIDIIVNARGRSDAEVHIVSVALASMLGAYLGALPIPLDWDRPWQQWPLTCVYGVLTGCTVGNVAAVAIVAWIKKRKAE